MFALDSQESFKNVGSWMDQIKENTSDVEILLLGNKADLEGDREVSNEEATSLAEEYGVTYFETSAKTG